MARETEGSRGISVKRLFPFLIRCGWEGVNKGAAPTGPRGDISPRTFPLVAALRF